MKPVSLRTIKALSDYHWEIWQQFERRGKIITVQGWGFNRNDALQCFAKELEYAETEQDFDPLQDIGNVLWIVAGWIDQAIKATRNFMQFILDEFGETL